MTSAIHLLLIEGDLREANRIRTSLAEIKSAQFHVESVQRLSSGLDRLSERGVDAVLVDLSLGETPGLEPFLRLRQRVPDTPILVLAEVEDEKLALQAVREGAQDYLVKGKVPGEALARCVRYAIERNRSRNPSGDGIGNRSNGGPGRVLTFLGAKGGVGTSTVALNIAAALAKSGNSVIAAELRPYSGTFAYQLRRLPPPRMNLENPAPWTSPLGFRVFFSPLEGEETQLPAEAVATALHKLAAMARFVVVDLPPNPSEATREVIRHSEFVGLVTEREPTSVHSAGLILERMRNWSKTASLGAVVVNRVALSAPPSLPEIGNQLGIPVVSVIPPAADACLQALKAGKPLVMFAPDSLAAASLTDLAERLGATTLYLTNSF